MIERTQVLVVGAGPVGATLAYALDRLGIDVLLIEAASGCHEDMRASTIHPPTLEMLEDWGLLPPLEEQGLRAPVYQYRNRRTGGVLEFDLGELADISRHPYRLQCEQFKLAALASNRLNDRVRFSERVIFLDQDENGVTVHCETPLDVKTYHAQFVIGADGASSIVRKLLGVKFEGFTYPEKFLTLSTDYPIEEHLENLAKVSYIADRQEWCVLLRVPTLWRVLVPATADQPDAFLLSEAKKDQVFRGLLRAPEAKIRTYHRTIYRVHQRVVERYDHGRVALVGDAAHLNNPLGGFGMNSGLHDAWNLAEKIRLAIFEGGDYKGLFAQYDRQRRTIMHEFVQSQTIANHAGMLDADERQAKFERILADPVQRRRHLLKQSMYDSREHEAQIN